MSIEAMKHALEALDKSEQHYGSDNALREAIQTLRAAIAEASMQRLTDVQQEMEQEPVAWVNHGENRITRATGWDGYGALYTAPPRREWVSLTDEEIEDCWDGYLSDYQLEMIRAIEAKLKEKNS
jgi:hypothetical protein